VNNHHPDYYRAEGNTCPPGDWENPVPVYFLAVEPGTAFRFALAKRHQDVNDRWLQLARQWLLGALCYLGAGAKTNAGYGCFEPVEEPRPSWRAPRHASFEANVELITPAFLAGANQHAEDCELRPPTLRGLLRLWWRTLHAGFMDVATLRSIEAQIWGDTKQAGAVRVEVSNAANADPRPFAYKQRFDPKPEFARQHGLAAAPNRKTTQGLFYASYGMDEKHRSRHHLEPGASWTIRLTAADVQIGLTSNTAGRGRDPAEAATLPAAVVLEQAIAALTLLSTYAGVGSKSRKGFGSLQLVRARDSARGDAAVPGIDGCRQCAAEFRRRVGLPTEFDVRRDHSGSLGAPGEIPHPREIPVPWGDPWKVMDEVGFAYQAFAQEKSLDPSKAALGLPRKIHGPLDAARSAAPAPRPRGPAARAKVGDGLVRKELAPNGNWSCCSQVWELTDYAELWHITLRTRKYPIRLVGC
jgi:CRISPR-associated protein Cmr6